MAVLESLKLSPRQRAENNYELPDNLSLYEICDLWRGNESSSFSLYLKAMYRAYKNGKLKGEYLESYYTPGPDIFGFNKFAINDPETMDKLKHLKQLRGLITDDQANPDECKRIVIHKRDFLAWLEIENEPKPTGCLLEKWWIDSLPTQQAQAQEIQKSKYKDKSSQERESQLHKLIWRVYQHLSENDKINTAQAVWNEIRQRHSDHDEEEIIQEVNQYEILWCSAYGNESKLKRSTFDKTLSTLKKNHHL